MDTKERFNSIYDQLKKIDFSALESDRKKAKKTNKNGIIKSLFLLLVFSILSIGMLVGLISFLQGDSGFVSADRNPIVKYRTLIFATFIFLIIWIRIKGKRGEKFKNWYKNNYIKQLCTPFVKLINPNYSYDDTKGIREVDYNKVAISYYAEYMSKGLITGVLNNGSSFEAGQVTTWDFDESTDSDGRVTRTKYVNFEGMCFKVNLPFNINSNVRLRSDKGKDKPSFLDKLIPFKTDDSKVKMDSEEFEKIFDVYAPNQVLAMQIFTADIMMELIDLHSTAADKYEITLENDKLYIGFANGRMFKAPGDLKINVLDKDVLYDYFYRFERDIQFIEKLIEIISKCNI